MFALSLTLKSPLSEDPRDSGQFLFGCFRCAFLSRCGGLGSSDNAWDCFGPCKSLCRSGCPYICPKSADESFVRRLLELSPHGFEIETVVASGHVPQLALSQYIPRVDHGSNRVGRLSNRVVAVPLRFLVNCKTGAVLFKTGQALAAHFGIARSTKVLAIGVAKDDQLELLWGVRRLLPQVARRLRQLGVVGVTAPNFSSFANAPRTEDMANFVRQALIWRSFVDAGMPSAYHFNGRTAADARNIAKFIQNNPTLYWVSAEFDTGAKQRDVFEQFVADLVALPELVGRPLGIILFGGVQALDRVKKSYERVCFVDGNPFFKMVNRRALSINPNGSLTESAASRTGRLDELFARNVGMRQMFISRRITQGRAG